MSLLGTGYYFWLRKTVLVLKWMKVINKKKDEQEKRNNEIKMKRILGLKLLAWMWSDAMITFSFVGNLKIISI